MVSSDMRQDVGHLLTLFFNSIVMSQLAVKNSEHKTLRKDMKEGSRLFVLDYYTFFAKGLDSHAAQRRDEEPHHNVLE
jgi:hypothetical protein